MHLLGQKIGMTHLYSEDGTVVPVTVVRVPKATVVRQETSPGGKAMVQAGINEVKEDRLTKPEAGHLKKHGVGNFSRLFSFPSAGASYESGQQLGVVNIEENSKVDVVGLTKGRGFTGVMKRHGFSGSSATHGQSKNHRKPASGGATDAARTLPGTRKPGHYGHEQRTIRNLQVVKILPEDDVVLLRGAVPGPENAYVTLRVQQVKTAEVAS